MASILSRPQCVNDLRPSATLHRRNLSSTRSKISFFSFDTSSGNLADMTIMIDTVKKLNSVESNQFPLFYVLVVRLIMVIVDFGVRIR